MKITKDYDIKSLCDVLLGQCCEAEDEKSYYVKVPIAIAYDIVEILTSLSGKVGELEEDKEEDVKSGGVASLTKTFECFGDDENQECQTCKNYIFGDCVECIGCDIEDRKAIMTVDKRKELFMSVKMFDPDVIGRMGAVYYSEKAISILGVLHCILSNSNIFPKECKGCKYRSVCEKVTNRFSNLKGILNEKKSKVLSE